jgi:antitoxin StbD
MQQILATFSASMSELKRNPKALIEKAEGETIAIFNRNLPAAYLVSPVEYERMMNQLEDYELGKIVKARQAEKPFAIEVSLDDL